MESEERSTKLSSSEIANNGGSKEDFASSAGRCVPERAAVRALIATARELIRQAIEQAGNRFQKVAFCPMMLLL